ncbi:MAG: FHA domain-containing protein [Prochloraceae cyanobacterium]
MDKIPYLILHTDRGDRHLNLTGSNVWKIGRDKNSDFIITDQWTSQNHAFLIKIKGNEDFYLVDLGSRNGTFINGDKITVPTVLKNGDRLVFGKTKLEFHCPNKAFKIKDKINQEYDEAPTSSLHVRRLISAIAIELRDYNILARQLDDNILTFLINNWVREIDKIISNYRGQALKSLGGTNLTFWYHKKQKVSEAELINILNCIAAIEKITTQLNQKYPLPWELKISVAVNIGYAMVGNLGSKERFDYTPIGETVNLALGLGNYARDFNFDLILSENTFKYLENAANYCDRDRITLEGYQEAIEIAKIKFEHLKQFLNDQSQRKPQ